MNAHPSSLSDRELLTLAAKAADIVLNWSDIEGVRPRRADTWDLWNPLEDDGDALRLAVKLRIDLEFSDFHVEAYQRIDDTFHIASEGYAPGSEAATRRAIVRAAASLAK